MQEKFEMIPRAELMESLKNPRKHFSDESLEELAVTMRSIGVVEPLIVREIVDHIEAGISRRLFEIVCGARRYRASERAGLEKLPCMIRELTDDEAYDIRVIENLQREDINPLEEAEAYMTLSEQRGYSLDDLALKFGKKTEYIFGRMRLNNLVIEAKKLLEDEILPVTAALKLTALSVRQQLAAIARTVVTVEVDGKPQQVFTGLKDLRIFLEQNILMELGRADFDPADATLTDAVDCLSCPKRSGNGLFKGFVNSDRCLDSACFKLKHVTHYLNMKTRLMKEHKNVVFAAKLYASEREYSDLGEITPMLDYVRTTEKEAKKNKKYATYAVFVGMDRVRAEGEAPEPPHGWILLKAKKVADPVVAKQIEKKEKKSEDLANVKEAFYQAELMSEYQKLGKKKIDGVGLMFLAAQLMNAMPWGELLLGVIHSYKISIPNAFFEAGKEITIDSDFKITDETPYITIDVDQAYEALDGYKESSLQMLIIDLIYCYGIIMEGAFYKDLQPFSSEDLKLIKSTAHTKAKEFLKSK